eukprot:1647477-Pyramimonas_sp.AAC.1
MVAQGLPGPAARPGRQDDSRGRAPRIVARRAACKGWRRQKRDATMAWSWVIAVLRAMASERKPAYAERELLSEKTPGNEGE